MKESSKINFIKGVIENGIKTAKTVLLSKP